MASSPLNSTLLAGFPQGAQSLSQTIALPTHQTDLSASSTFQLPPLISILGIFFNQNETKEFFSGISALDDTQFTGTRPIVGVGHHFIVYASPFAKLDDVPERVARVGGEVYCIKAPNSIRSHGDKAFRNEYYRTVLQELRVLSHPDLREHENIIGLLGFDFQEDYDDNTLCWPVLLLEYSDYGTLDSFQVDFNGVTPQLVRNFLLDIAKGLQTLHNCNIIHGDVKSENVLVCGHPSRKYVAKLSDFGLAVINPASTASHYLPGCTWLWSAPEIHQPLTVNGLKLTDVYSFGLTAWRILSGQDNPFMSILALPPSSPNYQTSIRDLKNSSQLPQMVMQSLQACHESYVVELIAATLQLDPVERSLGLVLQALSNDYSSVSKGSKLEIQSSSMQQDIDPTTDTMTTINMLNETFPWDFIELQRRPAVLHSLLECLDVTFSSNSIVAVPAAELYFNIINSPGFQLGDKSIANQSRVLDLLRQRGPDSLRLMAIIYYQMSLQVPESTVDPMILETAVHSGSYSAFHLLRNDCLTQYQTWKEELEEEASRVSILGTIDHDRMLIAYCRTGNFVQCHAMLDAGASALCHNDGISALHYLTMHHHDEVEPLIQRLIDAGAELDQSEGTVADDDFFAGRAFGIPLHWAIMHRNLAAIRALTKDNDAPQEEDIERSFFIAVAMHFYDVVEFLRDWAIPKHFEVTSQWTSNLYIIAAANLQYHRSRQLRHSSHAEEALHRTLDALSTICPPTDLETITVSQLFNLGIVQNYPAFLSYFLLKLNRSVIDQIPENRVNDFLVFTIMSGFVDIFEMLYEHRVIDIKRRFSADKWTGIQLCMIARQRNPYFVRRYIQWGCEVDEMGDTPTAQWTPFTMAVQTGLFEIASMLLRYGANKDRTTGWLGGNTPLFRILHTWPDAPISRVRYMVEDLPRQGFGHIDFMGWPANGANMLYCFAMAVWSHYRNSYKFTGTMRYLLGMLHDKSCINKLDRTGSTVLNYAARTGNLEVARILIEAGADVNGGLAISPLNAAMEWRDKWLKKEQDAGGRQVPGELRHTSKVRARADELIQLLRDHGARERGIIENQQMMISTITSGDYKLPKMEYSKNPRTYINPKVSSSFVAEGVIVNMAQMLFEIISGVFDRSSMVNPGSVSAHPTRQKDFTAHTGKESYLQPHFRWLGQKFDKYLSSGLQANSAPKVPPNTLVPLYLPHSCYPWQPCPWANGCAPQHAAPKSPCEPPSCHGQNGPWSPSSTNHVLGQSIMTQPKHASSSSVGSSSAFSPTPWSPSGLSQTSTLASSSKSAALHKEIKASNRSSEAVQQRLRAALDPEDDFQDTSPTSSVPGTSYQYSQPPASATLTRAKIINILQSELSEAIVLQYKADNIGEVVDIAFVESTVTDALGKGLVKDLGLEFVPELGDDGRSLWMHVNIAESGPR